MRKIILALSLSALAYPSFAQKAKKQNTKTDTKVQQAVTPALPDNAEEPAKRMAMQAENMMGPMHHYLMEWAGHWREEMKIWSMMPGKNEPTIILLDRTGVPKAEGRFLSCEFRGTMNGRVYEAYANYGYDNAKKKFVKTWFDNTGTGILVLEGDFDEKANKIDFRGNTVDPLTKQTVKIHQVLNLADPSNHVLEIFIEGKDGKEVKTMEIISKRG